MSHVGKSKLLVEYCNFYSFILQYYCYICLQTLGCIGQDDNEGRKERENSEEGLGSKGNRSNG